MLNGEKFTGHSIVIIIGKRYNLSYQIKQKLIFGLSKCLSNYSKNILKTKKKKSKNQQICKLTFQQIEKCQYVKGIYICCPSWLSGAGVCVIL